MFTGLVETTGTVLSVEPTGGATRLTIAAPGLASRLLDGGSVAVNGVCLTALGIEPGALPPRFSADIATETAERTTLIQLAAGSTVNLELPTPAGSPLGGHIVQGHVDGTGTLVGVTAITPGNPATDWRLRLTVPAHLTRHILPQGSITIDGISLTVAALEGTAVEVAIIPHTYTATNLHTLVAGAALNIETDILAKYAARQQEEKKAQAGLTTAYLMANGY